LDKSCDLVLSYSWLTQNNPSTDWKNKELQFLVDNVRP